MEKMFGRMMENDWCKEQISTKAREIRTGR